MKKVYSLENLDCPNCAAKMEKAINDLDNVSSAKINFLMQKLTLDAKNEKFENTLDCAQKEISKIEHECKIVR